jgi:hypothetical protein
MSAMRARLTMKLVSVTVMLVLSIVTARSCSGGSGSSSPLSPSNLTRNGVAGLCANQQAAAAASGSESSSTALTLPSGDQGELAQMAGISAQSLDCTTTTLPGNP